MVVNAGGDYQLFVDNVAWQPIETTDEGDVYIIASGGRFVFYTDGAQAMTFVNNYTPDFQFLRYQRGVFTNEGGTYIPPNVESNGYIQAEGRPAAVRFSVTLLGGYSENVTSLAATSNQGPAEVSSITDTYFTVAVDSYDPTKYLQVMLGNVLLAFITPFNE